MAVTSISNMQLVPNKFAQYTLQRTTEKSTLVRSGVCVSNPTVSQLINGVPKGGNMIVMPHYKPLEGEDEVFGEYTMEAGDVKTGNEAATILVRQKAWGDTDLSKCFGGDDPMSAIANLASDWWNIREQVIMLNTLKGAFGSALAGHIMDVSGESTANYIDVDTTLAAKNLMGDAFDKLGLVFMHSATYTQLQSQQQITTEYDSDLKVKIDYYLGYQVVVDDSMPCTGGVFDTYFLGKGAFSRDDGMLDGLVGYETDRDTLSATNYLINRRCLIMHPNGLSFNTAADFGTQANGKKRVYARNVDLATAANWSLAVDHKNVPMVCLRHKLKNGSKFTPVSGYLKGLTVASAASTETSGQTALTITEAKQAAGNTYAYKSAAAVTTPLYGEVCNADSGYTAWNGTDEIKAKTGDQIVVVEIDAAGKAVAAGTAKVTSKA